MPKSFQRALIAVCLLGLFALPHAAFAATDTITVAGGCFWGMESVFDHTKGVTKAVAGYAGGKADTAHYETVSTGNTGHAESVQISFDPAQISLAQILDIYFTVAHNPTELNYQGPDHGNQYRSAIFYSTPEQQQAAIAKIAELTNRHAYRDPIVTKLEPLTGFYPAEDYHQHYADLHPNNPYIQINDAPKVQKLRESFPEFFKG